MIQNQRSIIIWRDMGMISFEELSAMTYKEILALVEQKKKESPDIDAQRERYVQRLSEEAMILRRETKLSYRELMLSYDI